MTTRLNGKATLTLLQPIAEQLRLPTEGWVSDYGRPTLACDGFTVRASVSVSGLLLIEQSNLKQAIKRKEAVLEQKKRGEFKP